MATRKKPGARAKAGSSREETKLRKANFIEAYIANGGNATKAAETAGYSAKSAKAQGSRLLTDVDVKAALVARAKSLADRYKLTTERVTEETARIAYFDIADCFDTQTGALLPIHLIPEDARRALASVEVVEMQGGMGVGEGVQHVPMFTKKLKASDKNTALERAFKHLGLFKEDNAQMGKAARRFFEVPRKNDK